MSCYAFREIMQADLNVELGADDHCLEMPWSSEDGKLRFFDLRAQPELLLEIRETHNNRELAEFLSVINQPGSLLFTAKCDTWLTNELDAEDETFGAQWKLGSYVDLVFAESKSQMSLIDHEKFAGSLKTLLNKVPDFAAAVDLTLRRCYYHRPQSPAGQSDDGYFLTFYLSGYGDDEAGARKSWCIGLKLVQNAILQLSSRQGLG